MLAPPDVRYARSADLSIAYALYGKGAVDLVIVPGFISNLDMVWEIPAFASMLAHLGGWARCAVLDKRGTGLSDRERGFGSLEERMDDIRAVMDDAEIERAALFGYSEGGPLSILFAGTYPERVSGLVVYGSMARVLSAPDYPEGLPAELVDPLVQHVERTWGSGTALRPFVQHIPHDEAARRLLARYERGACTPSMAARIIRSNTEIDVRAVLPTVSAPTLVLHSSDDPLIPAPFGRYLGDRIDGSRYVEGDADYHMTWHGGEAWFLDEIESFLTGHRLAPKGERFLATVLFTDIVGSTETAARHGDRAWRTLLDRHDALAAEHVTRFGGRVVKTTGDGMLAVMESPSRAVECALALRGAIEPLGLEIRAGVHTGEVERRDRDIGGLGVHIGARIAALAQPGEVCVSRTVRDITAGSGLGFVERGRHLLKGVPDEWELYAVR